MNDERLIGTGVVDGGPESRMRRIGLVATDPLRILGLQQIFGTPVGASADAEIIPLSVPGVMQDATLVTVFIDASCTDHLFELISTFRRMRPHVRLIVIGDLIEPEYIQRVIGAGARGYLLQTASENEIRTALAIVSDGSVWAPRKVLARLLDASVTFGASRKEVVFTPRESEIVLLLVSGLANREIGSRLSIDVSTVKAHLARLMRKTGVKNRIELTLFALQRSPAIRSKNFVY